MAADAPGEQREGGFGSGLRAKMEARAAVEAPPRSPGEAVAVAAAPPPPPPDADLHELRAELEASFAREHQLRTTLDEQLAASSREVEFEQEIGRRLAELEARAATLDEREDVLAHQERRVDERLTEFDDRHAELERLRAEIDATAIRVSPREQAVTLKVQELTSTDAARAEAAEALARQAAAIAEREKAIATAEVEGCIPRKISIPKITNGCLSRVTLGSSALQTMRSTSWGT